MAKKIFIVILLLLIPILLIGWLFHSSKNSQASFGTQQYGTLAGYVFSDVDANGSREGSEVNVSGIQVTIDGPSGNFSNPTNSNGAPANNYTWSNLIPGSYTVTIFPVPAGWRATTAVSVTVSVPAGDVGNANFGIQELGTIAGYVWSDLNGNGSRDGSSPNKSGVTVSFSGGLPSQTTNATGSPGNNYGVAGVIPGTYDVTVSVLSGWRNTTAVTVSVSVSAGGFGTANFGLQEYGSVVGYVWSDLDGDGVRDGSSPNKSGVTVSLSGVGSVDTNANASPSNNYSFGNVVPGSYTVSVALPGGWYATTAISASINLSPGETESVNFGMQEGGSIVGYVWSDLDGNGSRDGSSPNKSGVTVSFSGGLPSQTTNATAAPGNNYTVSNIQAGTYTVTVSVPSGWRNTTSTSVTVTVAAGGFGIANFGLQEYGSIAGYVWSDLDGNGSRDGSSPNKSGVPVSFSGGLPSQTTNATASPGNNYGVPNVIPGTYTVTVSVPSGWRNTTATSVGVTVSPGGSGTANFGVQELGSIAGYVWSDLNGNGSRDGSSPNRSGETVSFSGGLPSQTTNATASPGNNYGVSGITPGTYNVTVSVPSGWRNTTVVTVSVAVSAGGSAAANFGLQEYGTVVGYVWSDLDGNGSRDGSSPNKSGVTVSLSGVGSVPSDGTASPGNNYSFNSVIPGSYTVSVTLPGGWYATTAISVAASVSPGGTATANFGMQQGGSIVGYVWSDLDGNGSRDGSSPNKSGVTVSFSGGLPSQTTNATASPGNNYGVSNIQAGTYTVTVSVPSGWRNTTATSVSVTVSAGGTGTANFGLQEYGSIVGYVWSDLDGNGSRDGSSTNKSGVTVSFSGGLPSQTTNTTASPGNNYGLSGIVPGTYTVTVSVPSGWRATTLASVSVSVSPGGSETANFGVQELGSIAGYVWSDLNGNGSRDGSSPNKSGVTVSFSGGLPSQTTNATGSPGNNYGVSGITPGTYNVTVSVPSGWRNTTVVTVSVAVSAGGSATANFGLQEYGTVVGYVWSDLNGNGVRDGGSPNKSGVTVSLSGVGSTNTNTNASPSDNYSFNNVIPGSYTVSVTLPGGWYATTAISAAISVSPGGTVTVNFGMQEGGSIVGYVWSDLDGNGSRGGSSPNKSGVTVSFSGGLPSQTTNATAAPGNNYTVSNSQAGTYTVTVSVPSGWRNTTATSVTVTVAAGGTGTANFGLQEYGSLAGYVWSDLDGNGSRDGSSTNKSGVTVSFSGGLPSQTTNTTASPGNNYGVSSIIPGTYTVTVSVPSGWRATTLASVSVSVSPGGTGTANFGVQELASIAGYVWNDENGNGTRDGSSPNKSGVTVSFSGGLPNQTTNATASPGNNYGVSGIIPGTYNVTVSVPSGWRNTTLVTVSVTVSAGGSAAANFGLQEYGTVVGYVWSDLDGNGSRDGSSPNKSGVTVSLSGVGSTNTNTNASPSDNYSFNNVIPGSYTVSVTLPGGWHATTAISVDITLSPGETESLNFGMQQGITLSGYVWSDLDGNGSRDGSSPNKSGVTVSFSGLSSIPDQTTNTTLTPGNNYAVSNVQAGTYTITVSVPSGWRSTTATAVTVTVSAGSTGVANFGVQEYGSLAGYVWSDLDGNGSRDGSSPNKSGVTVSFSGASSIPDQITNTNAVPSNNYSVSGIIPGTYTVLISVPASFRNTTPTTVSVDVSAGGTGIANFGLQQYGSIAGYVWDDQNGNGARDGSSPNKSGVTVSLSGPSTIPSQITNLTAAPENNYAVSNVIPGSYSVTVTVPAGWLATTAASLTINVSPTATTIANFGLQQYGSISLRVFDDNEQVALEDGIRQISEDLTGVATNNTYGYSNGKIRTQAGTEVALFSNTSSTTISNITPGDYKVEITVDGNWRSTRWSLNNTTAAAYNPLGGGTFDTGSTLIITVTPAGNPEVYLGLRALGTIQGRFFIDRTELGGTRGVYDPGIDTLTDTSIFPPGQEPEVTHVFEDSSGGEVSSGSATVSAANIGDNCGGSKIAHRTRELTPTTPGGFNYNFTFEFTLANYFVTAAYFTNGAADCQGTYFSLASGSGDFTYTVSDIQLSRFQTVNLWVGLQKGASLGGYVWDDYYYYTPAEPSGDPINNRIRDKTFDSNLEEKIRDNPGFDILARTQSGSVVGTAYPDTNGEYRFTNLLPGNYTVELSPPSGYCTGTNSAHGETGWKDKSNIKRDYLTTTSTNQIPDCHIYPEQTAISPGQIVRINGYATDPNGDPVSWRIWNKTGGELDAQLPPPKYWTAPSEPGLYEILATVQDDKGATATCTTAVSVYSVNVPTCNISATPSVVNAGGVAQITGTASAPSGQVEWVRWFLGAGSLDSDHGAPPKNYTTHLEAGRYYIVAKVKDENTGVYGGCSTTVTVPPSAAGTMQASLIELSPEEEEIANLGVITDFDITVSPSYAQRVLPGGSVTYTVYISPDPSNCWGGNEVSLSHDPDDDWGVLRLTGDFANDSLDPNASSTTFTITAGSDTPEGEYSLKIQGESSSPGRERSIDISVIVQRDPWLQVIDSDLYVAHTSPPAPPGVGIDFILPDTVLGGFDSYFLAASTALRGGLVLNHTGDPVLQEISSSDVTSERTWKIQNYPSASRLELPTFNTSALSGAPEVSDWSNLVPENNYKATSLPGTYDLSGPGVALVYFEGDLLINGNFQHADLAEKRERVLLLINGTLTIAGTVVTDPPAAGTRENIEAGIIVLGEDGDGDSLILQDSSGDGQLKIAGFVHAQGAFYLGRNLDDNRYPTFVVNYEPIYLFYPVGQVTTSLFTWEEVKP